jgi:arylsulfatase A-like enzyme
MIGWVLSVSETPRCQAATPNIVYIMADDLGYGDLGITGQLAREASGLPAIRTPNIDALATSSLSFTNMYANPVCSPSRASLLTGFNQANSIIDRAGHFAHLRPEETTWAQILRDQGYDTAMYGKWHVGGVLNNNILNAASTPTAKGFDTVFGSLSGGYRNPQTWQANGDGVLTLVPTEPDPTWPGPGQKFRYSQDVITEHAVSYIREKAHGAKPFVTYLAYEIPHTPLNEVPIDPLYANQPWPATQIQYASMITRLDGLVQQVLNAIDDPNNDGDTSDSIAKDTMVVFTSDNGPLWRRSLDGVLFDPEFFDSNATLKGQKASTDEGGIKVPFYVRWPGVTTPGSVNESYVATISDILPTFAELVGQPAPLGIDGVSMLDAIRGEAVPSPKSPRVWSYPNDFSVFDLQGWSVRLGDWKLTNHFSTNLALYDLASDPNETNNLANTRTDIVGALQLLAHEQGLGREAITQHVSFPEIDITENTYYAQFKSWAPAAGSTDLLLASNWSGGTPDAGPQTNIEGIPEALNWNTGPADNWIARIEHTGSTPQSLTLPGDLGFLAVEVGASASSLELVVPSNTRLTATNGLRVGQGGTVRIADGSIATIKRLEVYPGGTLAGEGLVTGRQELLAGIGEFAGEGFLTPDVINQGLVAPGGPAGAGTLEIDGTYYQDDQATLEINIVGSGGRIGIDFDQLVVAGVAHLEGEVAIQLQEGVALSPGDQFPVVAAGELLASGIRLGGPDARHFAPLVTAGTELRIVYVDADFDTDGDVDDLDLAILTSGLGSVGAAHGQGDANGDGRVNGADFLAWQRTLDFGTALGSPVPEPHSGLVAVLVLGWAAATRSARYLHRRHR